MLGCCLLVLLCFETTALGDVRELSIDDPQDAPPTISGVPDIPDVKRASLRYDSAAGSIRLEVDYYYPVDAIDGSQNYAFQGNFRLSDDCHSSSYNEWVDGAFHVISSNGIRFYDRLSISKVNGYLDLSRAVSDGGKRITVSGQTEALKNRDLRCVYLYHHGRRYSSASYIYSKWDESCRCWYSTADTDHTDLEYFPGYEPITTAEFQTWIRASCRNVRLWGTSVRPRKLYNGVHPTDGRVELRFRFKGKKQVRRKPLSPRVAFRIPARRLRISVQYVDDTYREDSKRRTLEVDGRCH